MFSLAKYRCFTCVSYLVNCKSDLFLGQICVFPIFDDLPWLPPKILGNFAPNHPTRPLCSSGRCLCALPSLPLASAPPAAWRIPSNSRPFRAQATVRREKPGHRGGAPVMAWCHGSRDACRQHDIET